MARRKTVFADGEIYHIFNRSIAKQPIFENKRANKRVLEVISYYRYSDISMRFSYFTRLDSETKSDYLKNIEKNNDKRVEIFAYCLMPNHYHLLVRQTKENGISNFVGTFQNSFAKYFNKKFERTGSLFQNMFKAVRIENDEQFTHIMRYIHLNPYSSYLLKNIEDISSYEWSSLPSYLQSNDSLVNTNFALKMFPSVQKFLNFHLDQGDYQRRLEGIKHSTL